MIVSVRQASRCPGPEIQMKAFAAKMDYRDYLLAKLKEATADCDAKEMRLVKVRLAFVEKAMSIHEDQFKLSMRALAKVYRRLYIDSDGVVWTSPPLEFW